MRLTRTLSALALITSAGFTASALATPVFQLSGPNLTYGEISNGQTIISNVTNPAAGAVALETEDWQVRFGILSSVGFNYEVGPVDSMVEQLDNLSNQLSQNITDINQANQLINDFDAVLKDAGENGYFRLGASVHAPLMPLVITSAAIGGSLVFDVNAGGVAHMTVLDAPMIYNPLTQSVETASSLYIKGAVQAEGVVGYSMPIFSLGDSGTIYAGIRARQINMALRKTIIPIGDTNQDIGQLVQDEFNKDTTVSTATAFDAGLLYVADYYRVGVTMANINEPQFAYDSIGGNCNGLVGSDLTTCIQANTFASEIALDETHTMNSQVKLEAAVTSKNKNWIFGIAYDANPVLDPVGAEYQRASVSAAYAGGLAGLRFGYRTNLAGTQLSEAMFGLSLFSFLNLDVAYGLESIDIDGQAAPRSLAVNLGIELTI